MSNKKYNSQDIFATVGLTFMSLTAIFFIMGAFGVWNNVEKADVHLSQESANLVCQKITNNTNAFAKDWDSNDEEPEDSLICIIQEERISDGLIQIKKE